MSKRYLVTLSDAIADLLDRWTESENGKASGLIAFIVEKEVRDRDERGLIPPANPNYKEFKHLLLDNYDKLSEHPKLKDRINDLIQGAEPSEAESVRIAYVLRFPENYVEKLINGTTNA